MEKTDKPSGVSQKNEPVSKPQSSDQDYQTPNPEYTNLTEMFDYLERENSTAALDTKILDKSFPSNRYAICMTPRSGSTYLAHLLKNTKHFGFPEEWLSISHSEKEARSIGAIDLETYLRRVFANNASPNGVSGIEISIAHWLDAKQIKHADKFLNRGMKYFYLRRRNIVRQGISMHIAHQSGVLHSYQLNDEAQTVREAVIYDTHAIRQFIKMIHDEELRWEHEFGALGIEPDRLYYEEIIQRPERVLRRFAHMLGLPETPLPPKDVAIKKMSDERTDEWETRYRKEDAAYLTGLTHHRPFVHKPVKMT